MNQVKAALQGYEENTQSKVIYACESGSRAYGTNAAWSDFDVRFIYVQPIRHYLNVNKKKNDSVSARVSPNLELNGWDLFKTMDLFTKSNPSLYEALFSPVIYLEEKDFSKELQRLAKSTFSLKTMSYHYLRMVKSNLKMIREKELQPNRYIKTLLQAIRGIMMMNFINKHQELPPIEFKTLIGECQYLEQHREEINQLLQMKNNLNSDIVYEYQDFILLMEKEMEQYEGEVEYLPVRQMDKQLVNNLIWEILEV